MPTTPPHITRMVEDTDTLRRARELERARTFSAAADAPATCQVRGWVVFAPGLWKGELYTPERVRRMAENFDRLKGWLTPVAGLGHDKEQRLERSLGLPNVGRVVGVRVNDRSQLVLDVDNVPTWVGAQINAGRYAGGSIEVKPSVPDPGNPAKEIEGPVLDGVAFLGEEQPAVKGCPPPRATFADGREVPPSSDPVPVPAAVAAQFAACSRPAAPLLAFSASATPRGSAMPPAAVTKVLSVTSPRVAERLAQRRSPARTYSDTPDLDAVPSVEDAPLSRGEMLRQLYSRGEDVFSDEIMGLTDEQLQARIDEHDRQVLAGQRLPNGQPVEQPAGAKFSAGTPAAIAELAKQLGALPADERAKVLAAVQGTPAAPTATFSAAHRHGLTAEARSAVEHLRVVNPRAVERLLGHTDLGRQTLAKMRERAAAAKTFSAGGPAAPAPTLTEGAVRLLGHTELGRQTLARLNAQGLKVVEALRHTNPRVYQRLTGG